MKKYFLLLILLMSNVGFAHQPDLSTSLLSTTIEGKHILQITSSLTAFEGEIDFLYTKEAYKTPEEFKELVIKHFKKNTFFIINQKDTLTWGSPMVLLGHETKVIVEVLNLPKEINSFYFKNTMFKDMPHNKMALMFLSEGFPKQQLLLQNENEQTVNQELRKGEWKDKETYESKMNISEVLDRNHLPFLALFIASILIPLLYFKKVKNKNIETK